MERGSFSWHACSITACRCSRGACPTLFLAAHSPRPVVHKSAPVRQFLLLLMGHQKSMKAERPLLHADHTRFSSVKPHWKPGYAHGKSELGAFLHLPADELWSASILCCELFRSSFFSFGILFYQFTTFLTRCAVWSLGFTPPVICSLSQYTQMFAELSKFCSRNSQIYKVGIDDPAQNGGVGHLLSGFFLLYYGVLGGTYAELGRTEEMRKRFNAQGTPSHAHLVPGSRMVRTVFLQPGLCHRR